MVLDEERPQGFLHVSVHFAHAVAPGAEELGHACHVHVHLAVGMDVIPGKVLHVAMRQPPDEVVVQDAGDTVRKTGRCQTRGGCSGYWGHRNTGRCQTRGGCSGCWGHKNREVSD